MSKKEKGKNKEKKTGGEQRGGGRGTHGGLTKAGKVRTNTPKFEKINVKKSLTPRLRLKNKFLQILYNPKTREKLEYEG